MSGAEHKEFAKLIGKLSHRWHSWEVFRDFCEMAALSLSQAVMYKQEREERYLRTVGRYRKDEVAMLCELLPITVEALEGEMTDFLGEMFMSLELHSHWHGQYFTPEPICRMMARMNLCDGLGDIIKSRGYVTLQEPACGAGAMVIAFAHEMRDLGFNPQRQLHVTAIDVESTAAHMAYIQFSLLGLPAIVLLGNTLSAEMRERFDTLFHWSGNWEYKLRALPGSPTDAPQDAQENQPLTPVRADSPAEPAPATPLQAELSL